MRYVRTRWHGRRINTSLITGQVDEGEETVVIIQAFDEQDMQLPDFKVAYVNNGRVGLRLQLSNRKPGSEERGPWSFADDGPFPLYATASLEGRNVTGELDERYPEVPYDRKDPKKRKHPGGVIWTWSIVPMHSYQTWQYRRYWQLPVSPTFDPPLIEVQTGLGLAIDGWGHKTETSIVRTMIYLQGTRQLYLKSSALELEEELEQDAPFKTFVD